MQNAKLGFAPGTLVMWPTHSKSPFIVPTDSIELMCRKKWAAVIKDTDVIVISVVDGDCYSLPPADLTIVS